MIQDRDQKITQIFHMHKRTLVFYSPKNRRQSARCPSHQTAKVTFDAGPYTRGGRMIVISMPVSRPKAIRAASASAFEMP